MIRGDRRVVLGLAQGGSLMIIRAVSKDTGKPNAVSLWERCP